MALKQTISTPFGATIPNAYQRVEGLFFDTKNNIKFNLRSYVDNSFPFFAEKVFGCDYDINGENPIKQAYLHLKTLPEFADAVDC